jgi:hypothetical protein
MTRKDYEMIARIMDGKTVMYPPANITQDQKACFLLGCADQKAMYVRALADALASDNSRFNRSKFIEACGIND